MIKQARKVLGLTQAQLAAEIGVSERSLQRIEYGQSTSNATVVKLAVEALLWREYKWPLGDEK
jgi:DNA-binding XRE family transcriptional regulator